MLTSAATVVDRIVGLEMGADDYVTKPFSPRELAARVKSVLRRTSSASRADIGAEKVRIGRCVLDLAAHRLVDDTGEDVAMSPLEFDLLKALAEQPNRALSRERILNLTQKRDWDPFDRSVDLRVMRMRGWRREMSSISRPCWISRLRTMRQISCKAIPASGSSFAPNSGLKPRVEGKVFFSWGAPGGMASVVLMF
jgi:DNA-binding response OmpR family regulator